MKPLFGGFFRIAPLAQTIDDGRVLEVVADGGGRFWRWRTMGEATAEGRLDNCSPRLACLPGVSCDGGDLPPKSGCINYLQAGDVVSITALRR